MQISRIYSNNNGIFTPIDFNFDGAADRLNVIYGEVHHPKDQKRDSHNLGKSTLINLIDFLMLKGTSSEQFLVKHQERFKGFVFFIEIALNAGDFATVRRSALEPNKIALKRHADREVDMTAAPDNTWDHVDMSREEACTLLDAWLDLRVLKPYDYRQAITYFLRTQGDYSDELQLSKFVGKDKHWKPFVAHLFGFNEKPIDRKYELDESIEQLKQRQANQQSSVQYKEDQLPELQARITVLNQQVADVESQLDSFKFEPEERRILQSLVEKIEEEIADINERLYNIRYDIKQIDNALAHKDRFDLDDVSQIFDETKIHFPEQLKKNYEELVSFNKKVTQERNYALRKRRNDLVVEERAHDQRKIELDDRRENELGILRNTDTFAKFKELQKHLSIQRAQLVYLEEQKRLLELVAETARDVREAERDRGRVVDEIKAMVARPTPIYQRFSGIFNSYCQRVLNHDGIFFFKVNTSNNFDYQIGLQVTGQSNVPSSLSQGTSYRKLVCALFDLALLKVYEDASFFHFVYHDGILEALDNRKKNALITLIREQIANKKTQYILTLIDADMPRDPDGKRIEFGADEIVLRLHDDGNDGRLFKMPEF